MVSASTLKCPPALVFAYLHLQFAYGVVSQYLFMGDGDLKGAKIAAAGLRPVVLALDFASLLKISDHHNGRRLLLPYQSPEIHSSLGQRTYGRELVNSQLG